nr:MAG TPA: hypothetical protein [Caudoviricetes sp.]
MEFSMAQLHFKEISIMRCLRKFRNHQISQILQK